MRHHRVFDAGTPAIDLTRNAPQGFQRAKCIYTQKPVRPPWLTFAAYRDAMLTMAPRASLPIPCGL